MKTSSVMTALGTPSEFRRLTHEEVEQFVEQYTRIQRQNAVFNFVKNLYGPFVYKIVFLFGEQKNTRPRDANEKITGLLAYDSMMNLLPYDFGMKYWDDTCRKGTEKSYFDWILEKAQEDLSCNSIEEMRYEDAWKQYGAMAEAAETILYDEDILHQELGAYRDKTEYYSEEDRPLPYLGELYVRER